MNSWNPNSTNKLSMLVCCCISKFIYCRLQAVFSLLSVISCICLSFYWLVWKSLQLTNIWIYKGSLYMISYIYRLFCKSLLYIHNGWWWCLKHRNMFQKLKSVVVFLKITRNFVVIGMSAARCLYSLSSSLKCFSLLIHFFPQGLGILCSPLHGDVGAVTRTVGLKHKLIDTS